MEQRFLKSFMLTVSFTSTVYCIPTAEDIFKDLTGTTLRKTNPLFSQITEAYNSGDLAQVAKLATQDSNFYNIIMRRFAAPMSTRGEADQVPFNDMQALILGVTRDDLDFRLAMTGNFRYTPDGLNSTGFQDNKSFDDLSQGFRNLSTSITLVKPAWPNLTDESAAGVFTTRAWAEAHYNAGTNRRAVEYAFREFMCAELKEWKTPMLPTYYIHRDIPRNPSGDTLTFQNECRTCHALLDGMVGAFAKVDFSNSIKILKSGVVFKMNQDPHVFPSGYEVENDFWKNYATTRQNSRFGWRGETEGYGLKQFATMIANSRGFSECMVSRAFQAVCKKERKKINRTILDSTVQSFEQNYNLRNVFVDLAVSQACDQ